MCSGALLLDPKKTFSIKHLYTRRLLRIAIALLFWAIVYKIFDLVVDKSFSFAEVFRSIKEWLLFEHKYHLYFLHIIIIVYIWLPIVRIYTKHASQNDLRYVICVWFLFGIIYPTVKGYLPFALLGGIIQQWGINMTYAAIGYALLGFYMTKYMFSRRLSVLLMIAGFVVVFGGTVVISVRAGTLATGFLEGMTVGVALMSVGIFGLSGTEARISKSQFIKSLSKGSFCIYLVHVMIISLLQWVGITTFSPYLMSIPLVSLINVVLSYGLFMVFNRIPIIRDWII